MIIYSKSHPYNNAAIGRLEAPIKMIIEHESDLLSKKGGICDWLFNVEKSNKFGESIVGQNEFDVFRATIEGNGAESDTISETYRKFIEHIQFTKEFVITDADGNEVAKVQAEADLFAKQQEAEGIRKVGEAEAAAIAAKGLAEALGDGHIIAYEVGKISNNLQPANNGLGTAYLPYITGFKIAAYGSNTMDSVEMKVYGVDT